MSVPKIRAALETALAAMSPPLATAWENTAYTPTAGAPYQRVSMIFAEPVNTEYGRGFQQGGMFVVSLCWPQGAGMADITVRVELLRSTFYRGAAFTADGLTTTVARTPLILAAILEGDRYVMPVQVPFLATITS
ncbi:phage tail terminator-like protein [Caulobacter segnis]|jgi:hypothetical protein|uniref:phage tail terminator-like protein n=1 Tax=Caulobacter segnis TaxID=88688 RepID=UPI001CBE2F92|nr:phage tail terminator-like protein [Caulobacter segnis]UAL09106.1 DUF4128 domain-containing protein [Caulobacter segnis]